MITSILQNIVLYSVGNLFSRKKNSNKVTIVYDDFFVVLNIHRIFFPIYMLFKNLKSTKFIFCKKVENY